jgi:hypothetical protein
LTAGAGALGSGLAGLGSAAASGLGGLATGAAGAAPTVVQGLAPAVTQAAAPAAGALGTTAAQGLLGETLGAGASRGLAGAVGGNFSNLLNSGLDIGRAFGGLGQEGGFGNLVDSVGSFNQARSNLQQTPRKLGLLGLDQLTGGAIEDQFLRRERKNLGQGPLTRENQDLLSQASLTDVLFPTFRNNDVDQRFTSVFDRIAANRQGR